MRGEATSGCSDVPVGDKRLIQDLDSGFFDPRLRRGVGALARAFAHRSRAEDEAVLRDVARSSPLVHWAMRYARVVYLVDAGRQGEARMLLADAPTWPEESAFRSFHDELAAQVAG